ncbi:MAG: hypothetical protein H6512_10860 [Acidimicrobiia bacterium]|nr:hypothetical protein [Acidimicrobiia bacterium]
MTVSASFLSARGLPSAAADGLRRFVITLLLTCVGLGLLPAQRAAADAIDGLGRCEDAERPGLLEDIDTPQVALRTQSAYTLLGGGIALDVQIRGASAASQIRVEAFPAVRTVETLTGFTDGKPLRSDAFGYINTVSQTCLSPRMDSRRSSTSRLDMTDLPQPPSSIRGTIRSR